MKWTKETLITEAKKYSTRSSFRKGSKSAYNKCSKLNLLDEVCHHMLPIHNTWNFEKLKKLADTFNSINEFKNKEPNAYAAVHFKNFHTILQKFNRAKTIWNEKSITNEALKYSTKSEFAEKSGAYRAAISRNILNKVCSHMKKINSRAENEIMQLVLSKYPDAMKFKSKKIDICSNSNIKFLEIDIFVPSLNRGIEFDGEYWHSFDKMRADKRKVNWTDKQILEYHETKDNYFLSKGIQILHIKETDWIENKFVQIDKIFNFLGGALSQI